MFYSRPKPEFEPGSLDSYLISLTTVSCLVFTKSHIILKAWTPASDMWMKRTSTWKEIIWSSYFKAQLFGNLFLPLNTLYYQWSSSVRYFFVLFLWQSRGIVLEFLSYPLQRVYKLWGMGEMSCDWLVWECQRV